ncbi:MAG: hypothetical protein FJ278_12455 [Planctomycetes bacterium]|nr:hypothetical protein [Planctomycetota bacterium]
MLRSRSLTVLSLLFIGLASASAQPGAPDPPKFASDAERHGWVLNTLMPWMETLSRTYHNVPRSDGEYLRWLVVAAKRKRALEVGTSNGYSALWLGLGLEATKGHLTTVEIDPKRVQDAQGNLRAAGMLGKVVTTLEGDALKVVPALEGKFDFAFIDIGPKALPFFEAVEPKLTEDAVVAVHKPPSADALSDYLEAMKKRPEWLVTVVQTGARTGIAVSVRQPR